MLRRHEAPLVEPGTKSLGIVVPGNWNPAIFSPAWLYSQELISAEDLEGSQPDLIAPGVATFHLPWALCEVTQERLHVACVDEVEFLRVRDLVLGILRALAHTPIAALGINISVHLKINSEVGWHRIGDSLVPKTAWEGVLKLPGTRSVTVLGVRPDDEAGQIQVTVEPSQRLTMGVFVQQNDHFSLKPAASQIVDRSDFTNLEAVYFDPIAPSNELIPYALEILSKQFDGSIARANQVFDMISKLATDG